MLDQRILQRITSLINKERVSARPEDLIVASYDASKEQSLPDLVVKPLTADEVSAILKIAYESGIPVVPRATASGNTGGAVPIKGGIVIDTTLMNKIVEINPEDLTAVVEPGVVVADFQKQIASKGLFYPPDPASADFCTMGGNVAECAGGLRCIKYGVTRDYVLGLEIVLPDGTLIHTGAKTLKSVTGYDLTRLFVGSEGTLGIFTKIIVRLIPLPETVATLCAFFDNIERGLTLSSLIIKQGILPRALEIVDETCLKAIKQYRPDYPIPETSRSMLLIELDGARSVVAEQARQLAADCTAQGALQVTLARTPEETDLIWSLRKSISSALYLLAPRKISEDVCLPRSKLSIMLTGIKDIERQYRIPTATFGHAGDGNLHVHFLVSTKEHENELPSAIESLFRLTAKLGGTLSGEHGIGLTKARYLSLEVMPQELKLMKALKQLLDPKGLMNPGKIF